MSDASDQTGDQPAYPEGQFAIVEIMGHVTIVGRVREVQRFGVAMLAIEPLFNGSLLPVILQGGASIYRYTEVETAVAYQNQPKKEWQIPAVLRALMPARLLSAQPAAEYGDDGMRDDVSDDVFPLDDPDVLVRGIL